MKEGFKMNIISKKVQEHREKNGLLLIEGGKEWAKAVLEQEFSVSNAQVIIDKLAMKCFTEDQFDIKPIV
jgi:hypothetical protein